jgi:TrmH family RNA methyltransferase
LEGVEKPGNLGAVCRSAVAADVDFLISTGQSTDFYHPHCIRSSVGTVFRLPHLHLSNEEAKALIQEAQLSICTTKVDGQLKLYTDPLPKRAAWILGSEHGGLTAFWEGPEVRAYQIPMKSEIDSLNLSVSTALVLYEHMRREDIDVPS